MPTRYVHTNLVAKDWRRLAKFYSTVFACEPVGAERDLHGDWLDASTGIAHVRIRGTHLRLPGYGETGPTLEIFQYDPPADRESPAPNSPGYGHIAFAVDDVADAARAIRENGGRAIGEAVHVEIAGAGGIEFQYLADPEGNIIEIQRWD